MTTPDRALEAQALLDNHRGSSPRPRNGIHYIEHGVALAAVTEALGRRTPAGWKLVPIEPEKAEAMILTGWITDYLQQGATEQEAENLANIRWPVERENVFAAYTAMINAAPQPSEDK